MRQTNPFVKQPYVKEYKDVPFQTTQGEVLIRTCVNKITPAEPFQHNFGLDRDFRRGTTRSNSKRNMITTYVELGVITKTRVANQRGIGKTDFIVGSFKTHFTGNVDRLQKLQENSPNSIVCIGDKVFEKKYYSKKSMNYAKNS